MKLNVVVLLFLMITSCSAQKADYHVINDFLADEFKELKYDSIHVRTEPYAATEAIKLYEQGYRGREDQNSSYAEVWTTPNLKDWPFTEKEIDEIKGRTKRTEKNWTKKDFEDKTFVFKPGSLVENMNFRVSHMNKGTSEYVLRLSRPVFNKKKTYALFKYYLTELLMGGSPGNGHRGTVVMKKENGKWIAIASIREAVYE